MVIGFCGKLQTGKTTSAKILSDYGFERRSFATVLRRIVASIFGCTEKQLEESAFKAQSSGVGELTWRDVLIKTGMFLRSLDPDFFVRRLDWSGKLVAIDDVRFMNEVKKVKEVGGVVVRLHRDQATVKLEDASETELDNGPWDYFIDNSKDFLHLRAELEKIFAELGVVNGRPVNVGDRK